MVASLPLYTPRFSPCAELCGTGASRSILQTRHDLRISRFSSFLCSRKRSPAVAAATETEVAELMQAADALLDKLGTAEADLAASARHCEASEPEATERVMKLVCDESSCVIAPVAAEGRTRGPPGSFIGNSGRSAAETKPQSRDFVLSEGQGWQLGYDRKPGNAAAFTALLGSDTWNVSLTQQELTDFIQLLWKLQRSIATLQTCGEWGRVNSKNGLGPESALQLQTDKIWMEACAPQKQLFDLTKLFQQGLGKRSLPHQSAFHLRFVVARSPSEVPQREFEGHFSPQAVMRLLEHLEADPPAIKGLQGRPSFEQMQPGVAGSLG